MRLPRECYQMQQVIETHLPHLSRPQLTGLVLWVCGALLNEWEVVLSWRHEAKTASLQSSSQERRHHQEIPVSDT